MRDVLERDEDERSDQDWTPSREVDDDGDGRRVAGHPQLEARVAGLAPVEDVRRRTDQRNRDEHREPHQDWLTRDEVVPAHDENRDQGGRTHQIAEQMRVEPSRGTPRLGPRALLGQ